MSCAEQEAERRRIRGLSAVFTVTAARSAADVEHLRELFRDYGRTPHVAACVAGFDEEIAGLPGAYAGPRGAVLIAMVEGRPAGCVALRPLDAETAELKRLYVRPEFRGRRIGEALTTAITDAARNRGFVRLRLDTLPSMTSARALYARLGFAEIPPCVSTPIPGVCYLELRL